MNLTFSTLWEPNFFGPYFLKANKDTIVLLASIGIIFLLIGFVIFIIELNCKNKKIKNILYLGFFIQLLIAFIDHFIIAFPTIVLDPRAFESLGWYSYLYDVNIGRGEYNYWIINPIYKLLKIRVAIIFSAINIFLTILINLNIYAILKKIKIDMNLIKRILFIITLSPISLIMKVGIQREAIIIVLVSYSLKDFIDYVYQKNILKIILAFALVGIAAIFHSGVIFLACGYLIYLISGRSSKKIYQFFILGLILIIFFIFKNRLLETVGGGNINQIIEWNNMTFLKEAGSGYLTSISTTSLGQIFLFLPLFIFYFLYSPTPDMIRGILDIATFTLNSSIYIYFTIYGIIIYNKVKKRLEYIEKRIIKALTISLISTIIVFSIGTRNAGTAMRHRDKLVPFLCVCFSIIKNREIIERKKINERAN